MIRNKSSLALFTQHIKAILCGIFALGVILPADSWSDSSASTFKTNLPDGLYLFQPYAGDEHVSVPHGDKDTVRPLVIVEKGKLVDPYLRAEALGLDGFNRAYVTGRTFQVYLGKRRFGTLANVSLQRCRTAKGYASDISGSGSYSGTAFPRIASKYVSNEWWHVGLKAVMGPFDPSQAVRSLGGSEGEPKETSIAESVRKHFAASGWKISSFVAVDLGDDEKLDAIVRVPDFQDVKDAFGSSEAIFVYRGAGQSEFVTKNDSALPAFILAGVLDLDGDGELELIVQRLLSSNGKLGLGTAATQIEIYRREKHSWQEIYRTQPIGCLP
jgi:hypothetical protein